METIYIDDPIKDKLVTQLEKFTKSSALYDRYGVTWKRVHLFHGPPGSGKTSTILALASRFGKNIAKLTLTPQLNSQQIEYLFQTIPDNTWMLLEDVDALFTERTAHTSIDFSTLLNCMDGLTTKRGLVLFMTTNHKTKLDSAFIRPGRVDLDLEFPLPGKEELRKALKVLGAEYEHEHEEFLEKHAKNMTIPSLQKHLFECMMDEKKSMLPSV
jgi:SpoVK/Ycf46/Vps4 family AAA+-type ATPase